MSIRKNSKFIMKSIILVSSLLLHIYAVNSLTINRKTLNREQTRVKRFYDLNESDLDFSDDSDVECPTEPLNCPQCLNEMSDHLIDRMCTFDIVLEVVLSQGKRCNELTVERRIKVGGIVVPNDITYSMSGHCPDCLALSNKTVTVMTTYDSYQYMIDGFSFDSNTIVVNGISPIRDCNHQSPPERTELMATAISEKSDKESEENKFDLNRFMEENVDSMANELKTGTDSVDNKQFTEIDYNIVIQLFGFAIILWIIIGIIVLFFLIAVGIVLFFKS